jgi:hypothetical protein
MGEHNSSIPRIHASGHSRYQTHKDDKNTLLINADAVYNSDSHDTTALSVRSTFLTNVTQNDKQRWIVCRL